MSTTMYTLSDFPAFAKLLRDTDDGKRDTHEADSCHGLLIRHASVPSSDSNPPCRSSDSNFSSDFDRPCRSSDSNFSSDFNECHIDDLNASADQSNGTDYENRVIGGTIENENNHSINDPFRRKSDSFVPGGSNNQPQRYTTAWSRDQLQRYIREEYYAQRDQGRDSIERRAKLWTLVALASGPLLLATLWKRRFLHSFGFCCTCPDSAASAASHAAKVQFLARLTYGCHCVPRAGAVTSWQKIESFFFSYTEPRCLCVISAIAAIVLFAWKWHLRNTSRRIPVHFGVCRKEISTVVDKTSDE